MNIFFCRYDLFLSFAINSFYWFYLRIQGIDPSQHELKSEINRTKEYMIKSKKLYERRTIMPRIDQVNCIFKIYNNSEVPKIFSCAICLLGCC